MSISGEFNATVRHEHFRGIQSHSKTRTFQGNSRPYEYYGKFHRYSQQRAGRLSLKSFNDCFNRKCYLAVQCLMEGCDPNERRKIPGYIGHLLRIRYHCWTVRQIGQRTVQADSDSDSDSESRRRSPCRLPAGWGRRVEAVYRR